MLRVCRKGLKCKTPSRQIGEKKRALITKPNAFNKNGQVRKQKQTEANQNKKTKEKYKTLTYTNETPAANRGTGQLKRKHCG